MAESSAFTNTIPQQVPDEQEAKAWLDAMLARFFLLSYLSDIPEFYSEWLAARGVADKVVPPVHAAARAVLADLSPEARDLLCSRGLAWHLYNPAVHEEAAIAYERLERLERDMNDLLQRSGCQYVPRIERLCEPLGVPGFGAFVRGVDNQLWLLAAGGPCDQPVRGPARDLLEVALLRGFTGLGPMDALLVRPSEGRQLLLGWVRALAEHWKRYYIEQRIALWVRNVVFGETIDSIASTHPSAWTDDTVPPAAKSQTIDSISTTVLSAEAPFGWYWVRSQLRDASRLLGHVRRGVRPRKGGVLRAWK